MSVELPTRPAPAAEPSRLEGRPSVGRPEQAAVDRQGWNELPPLRLDARRMEASRIVTASRRGDSHVALDILRTKLMKAMRENGWSTLAITSPTPGCGKTTIALNLAFSLAHQNNFRLALLDLDLRCPSVARLLGCERTYAIDGFLRGQKPLAESLVRHGMSLAIAPNTAPVTGASELLQACVPGRAIPMMRRSLGLDLVIFDLPPMLAADDALAILPAVDAVLLVAAADESSLDEIDMCERDLADQGKFLGLVLNKCRFVPQRYGY